MAFISCHRRQRPPVRTTHMYKIQCAIRVKRFLDTSLFTSLGKMQNSFLWNMEALPIVESVFCQDTLII